MNRPTRINTLNHNLDKVQMNELIDMFLLYYPIADMFELYLMFLLYNAIAELKQDMMFLLCYAIADLKQEREESRRGREAASNAS